MLVEVLDQLGDTCLLDRVLAAGVDTQQRGAVGQPLRYLAPTTIESVTLTADDAALADRFVVTETRKVSADNVVS